MGKNHNLITIATLETATHAALLKNVLEVEGVRAFVADGTLGDMIWTLQNAVGGIKLQVEQQDVEKAVAILENKEPILEDDEYLADEIEEEPIRDFENQREDDEECYVENQVEKMIERAYYLVMMGLLFLPIQLYASCLLIKIARTSKRYRKAKYKRKMYVATLINILVCLFMVIFTWFYFTLFPLEVDYLIIFPSLLLSTS